MFDCSNCHKHLEDETNFCPRCGFKQEILKKCPICFDKKKVLTLLCGHNICELCINISYKHKKECPVCRENIKKCPECYQFRVVEIANGKNKCLDCKAQIQKIPRICPGEKITCLECRSNRVLFDPINNRYNCSDCFAYFSSSVEQVVAKPKTRSCMVCFSNLIDFIDHPILEDKYDRYIKKNKCRNCELENVETRNY